MSSTAANPFQPPRAKVEDVRGASGAYQPVRFWSAKGRVSRLQYIGYLMGGYLLMGLGGVIVGVISAAAGMDKAATALSAIVALPYIVFSILMLIQRSHDMDWSGWTALLAFIPIVNLVWLFKAGTPGENRFGAPPPPNTTKVKLLALLLPAIAVIGIVVAVALPAYFQNAVKRNLLRDAGTPQRAIEQPAP